MLNYLLLVTALVEAITGIALLVVPSRVVELLLGEGLTSLQSLVLGRIAGAALISIGVVCWQLRTSSSTEQKTLTTGLLIYNAAVPLLLIHAAMILGMRGIAIWPAIALHAGLAIWCLVCLREASTSL